MEIVRVTRDTRVTGWRPPAGTTLRCPAGAKLPLMIKGICHSDDARRAREIGVDDIIKAGAMGATAAGIGRPYACTPALGAVDGVVHAPRSPVAEAGLQKRGAATDNSDYVDTQFHS
jgi:hypothetical protein